MTIGGGIVGCWARSNFDTGKLDVKFYETTEVQFSDKYVVEMLTLKYRPLQNCFNSSAFSI